MNNRESRGDNGGEFRKVWITWGLVGLSILLWSDEKQLEGFRLSNAI